RSATSPPTPRRWTASGPASRTARWSPSPAPSSPWAAAGCTASPSRFRRQAEPEHAAAAGAALDPDAPAVALEHARGDGKPDTAAGHARLGIQAGEHAEDLLGAVGRHAGPVVGHGDHPALALLHGADLDPRGPELRRVADQ